MKKLIALVMSIVTVLSMSFAVASAAETTTLTTTVPDATYTLNIPENQVIPFGSTSTDIGTVTVTESNGFAEKKNLAVTVTYDGLFKSEGVSTTIPYSLKKYGSDGGTGYITNDIGSALIFEGTSSGTCNSYFENDSKNTSNLVKDECLQVKISATDWAKALAGDYSTIITFSAKVVVEE